MAHATLKVLEGPLQGLVMPITRRSATIGSAADMPAEGAGYPALAPQHAAIAWTGAGFAVRDLTGGSGVVVDGEPVLAGPLVDGSVLLLGDLALELAVPAEGPSFDDPPYVPVEPAARPSRAGVLVAIVAGVTLLAFGLVALGAWFFQRPGAPARVGAAAPASREPRAPQEPTAGQGTEDSDPVQEAVRGATVVVEGPDAWGVGFSIGGNRILTSRTAMCGPDGDTLATITVTMHPETESAVQMRVPKEQVSVYRAQDSHIEGAVLNAGILRPAEAVTALALTLGSSESVKEGDTVTAAGYRGTDRSSGLQLASARVVEVVTDEAGKVVVIGLEEELPKGFSGGPVVDKEGRVVGLYSGTMSQDGEKAYVCVSTAVLQKLIDDETEAE